MSSRYAEHPQDVLTQWLKWKQSGPVALVIVSKTEGGSVRSPGALMAVAKDGRSSGYVSGGCVDADVILHAQEAIASREPIVLRYGAGSPFIDMPLPCGGAIEVTIIPEADEQRLIDCHDKLRNRRIACLNFAEHGLSYQYYPKLRIRIAGKGADALALARLAQASGFEFTLQLRDGEDVTEAHHAGYEDVVPLQSVEDIPTTTDDGWTAFILMFHDPDWEAALLTQALDGKAFYIGAVGSRRTQERRRERLLGDGASSARVNRIRGPVGLVPSLRDASMLAVSALAEIIEAYQQSTSTSFNRTGVLLLAAGSSTRFEQGDKLLAKLSGKPVIDHAGSLLANEGTPARIAVVSPNQPERKARLEKRGWQVIENPEAERGQSTSIKLGVETIRKLQDVNRVLVLLADMPFVPVEHLYAMNNAMRDETQAVMSKTSDVLTAPAIFSASVFDRLENLVGDVGAKAVFQSLELTSTVNLPREETLDIDTAADLDRASAQIQERTA